MPEPTEQQDEQAPARKKTTAAVPEPVPDTTTASASAYEPYPGADFFHGGRHSLVFTAMAARLAQEGCTDSRPLGPDWTNAHRDAFARWQKQLRPKEGGDVSGTPDEVAWDKLQIPRVTPLPRQEA
ncbi:hypothetical protein GCM10018777_56070 [Streptomyces albogriseolus]|uniref:hypothetical protein n=1 Tax=Streptomyces TaxID=1883 RepID=UPI00167728A5|nr:MULTISPECIES: hypothetical protein [Streptomyces]GHB15967.1 hypothetical protein GCM10010330_81290 [Streptomyces tendae]GHG32896.1 hypothetical protein GCM10018777_56070 [Streptomyces viridodiastaticus]